MFHLYMYEEGKRAGWGGFFFFLEIRPVEAIFLVRTHAYIFIPGAPPSFSCPGAEIERRISRKQSHIFCSFARKGMPAGFDSFWQMRNEPARMLIRCYLAIGDDVLILPLNYEQPILRLGLTTSSIPRSTSPCKFWRHAISYLTNYSRDDLPQSMLAC